MADKEKKFVIEIFRKKDAEELTAALSDPEGKLELGSAAALAGADAAAMALRAAKLAAASGCEGERMDWLLRNISKLREYLVYLIDEDVKGRSIMRRARREGDPQKIEAARQPASAISDEIVCQMIHLIELLEELQDLAPAACAVYVGSAVELALGALRSARLYLLSVARESDDETYRFVVRRENELRLQELQPKAEKILARAEEQLKPSL